ncbi:histidine-type phosphatase [Sphingomonas sp. PP-CC-3A-396]|uniref:histidine-type phosphatase n=1 Tax=Sphingomonas sp. PP-CC-3A-396 TaxID=2135655 RepID=UPI00104AED8B|nr:histidine-type phosphatase [Sphingomonas sp. PP-CC-3A-396]TCQ08439.1 4-phytase/acid phosphatase [Sphingomonas sp. PP-CC-3A-396]
MRVAPLAAGFALVVTTMAGAVAAQTTPPPQDKLERVVIVMRHGVRSAMSSPEDLGRYSRRAWPRFAVPPGHLTANGATLVTMLGGWYRDHYRQLGLLGTNDCAVYYWANHTQRTEATATALAAGLTPGCTATIHQSAAAPDPLFEAPQTPLAPLDPQRILAAISARVDGNLAAWDAQQGHDRDRFEALLLQCRRIPCSAVERTRVQRRLSDTPVAMRIDDGKPDLSSPSLQVAGIAESLVMAYADGLAFPGWRGIDAAAIGKALIVHGAGIDLRTRTPEVGRQTSSYLAMRLLATLQRGAGATALADPIGDAEKIVVLSGHDGTVTMLAGLLGLNWKLRDYGKGEAAPGGGLVFEVWRLTTTGQQVVRINYVAQRLDQMRYRTPLSIDAPPELAALSIAGCADPCSLPRFTTHLLGTVSADPQH